MRRTLSLVLVLFLAGARGAEARLHPRATGVVVETVITKAKIAQVTERGFVLTVGTEQIAAQDESATRFWRALKPAKRDDFKEGDPVTVRLRTDGSPVVLRELSDDNTWDWLERLRKEPVACTVTKVDTKWVTVALEGGAQYSFRYSDKSRLMIGGKAAPMTDLREGQRLYVKGRLLPTLDTWIVNASDSRLESTTAAKKQKPPKPLLLPPSGKIKGLVDLHQPQFSMVDMMVQGRLLHVTYLVNTTFKLDGKKATRSAIERGLWAEVLYRRDQFGRLLASQIELFHGTRS